VGPKKAGTAVFFVQIGNYVRVHDDGWHLAGLLASLPSPGKEIIDPGVGPHARFGHEALKIVFCQGPDAAFLDLFQEPGKPLYRLGPSDRDR
jgi:hypothetical protein